MKNYINVRVHKECSAADILRIIIWILSGILLAGDLILLVLVLALE